MTTYFIFHYIHSGILAIFLQVEKLPELLDYVNTVHNLLRKLTAVQEVILPLVYTSGVLLCLVVLFVILDLLLWVVAVYTRRQNGQQRIRAKNNISVSSTTTAESAENSTDLSSPIITREEYRKYIRYLRHYKRFLVTLSIYWAIITAPIFYILLRFVSDLAGNIV